MKKVTRLVLIVVILVSNSKVWASTVTWSDITNQFEELNGDGTIVTYDDSSMKISINNEDSELDYSIDFKYEDNIISLIQRDKSSFDEELMVSYGTVDTLLISYLLGVISNLNDVDYDLLDADNFEKYGITLNTEEVSYENNDEDFSVSMKTEYINDFSIDLDEFEKATLELKGTYNENEESNDTVQDDENIVGNEDTQDNDNITKNENSEDDNDIITNPKTGSIWIYLTLGCLVVSSVCFGLAFKYSKKSVNY